MRKSIVAAIGAAATVAVAGGTGLAMASTSHPAATGTEHFQLMSTSASSNRDSLVAYGAFTAAGVDISGNGNTDTVDLPGGTFRLTHKQTGGSQHVNPATCLLTVNQRATYRISDGTGRYAGISGSGKATVAILGIGARNSKGGCAINKAPAAFQFIVRASGPVTLP